MKTKTEKNQMNHPRVVSRAEWLAARLELLKAEKEFTRRSDEAIVTASALKNRTQRTSRANFTLRV